MKKHFNSNKRKNKIKSRQRKNINKTRKYKTHLGGNEDDYSSHNDLFYVEQHTFKIIDKNAGLLKTSGLATCTALAMNIGTKKFMAHIDTPENTDSFIIKMMRELERCIEKENVEPNTLKAFIYNGEFNSAISVKVAEDICKTIGIRPENIFIEEINMFDTVYI